MIRTGEVVDDRFEIEQHAGSGGMGDVYRARDLRTGEAVAVKVLVSTAPQELSRFVREAQALAAIRVPGVVRYLAHGTTKGGRLYLAMEWLTGETLGDRLTRKALTTTQSVALATRVAITLGAIHRLGIVHRDLKPSNLLLVDGEIERITLIDFGVARLSGAEHQLTSPGALVGTPGYMAPEQARGQQQIDARADVFALGCVLFKCLTGRPPFQGTGLAVLAKVLLEEPPRLREIRADIPEQLEELVARMLAKAPEDRPPSGEAVAAELAALEWRPMHTTGSLSTRPPPELTSSERKVMCLVLAKAGLQREEPTRNDQDEERTRSLDAVAERYHGQLEMLEGRLPVIVLSGAFAPTDLAARAARCALTLQPLTGGAPVALVTGRAEIAGQLPVGELIDRAVQLLAGRRDLGRAGAVRIDEVTAGLLGSRFETSEDTGGYWLVAAREATGTSPQLLGRHTACVGRHRELAMLTAEFRHCVEEPAATAVLVTGAAGMGKSRLHSEFVQSLRDQDEAAQIWVGQADPMRAGSAFSLLAHALRNALGLVDGEPIEARRRKVRERVERHLDLDAPRVSAFLGELAGAPFPDDDDVQLRAARRNAMLMGDQLRLAWEDFVRVECMVQPVVLVLEDLHWGDLPTVTMVDAALRNLVDMPFMVLALARSDVREIFPKLWHGRRAQEVRLTPLPRRACEQLVRQALGASVSQELVAKLVQRADGNAFYLEEEIRAAAQGRTDNLPETVLAMVQAGLETLDAEARRVLRAASIFGETFSLRGVAALLGGGQVASKLVELTQREFIRVTTTLESGDVEYRFRHALVREAAYGMLTERDLRLGHALAGKWLEREEDTDPIALAEHFERGGEPARAARAYLQAAQQALRGDDLAAAIERAERGVSCGPAPAIVGSLRLVEAEARLWRGEHALAEQRALEALEQLKEGSAAWFSAAKLRAVAASKQGGFDRLERWIEEVRDVDAEGSAIAARDVCLVEAAQHLAFGGRYALADELLEAVAYELEDEDPSRIDVEMAAQLHQTRSIRAIANGDPGAALASMEAALAAFTQAGDRRNGCVTRTNLGFLYAELGDAEEAENTLQAALMMAERLDLQDTLASVTQNLGLVLSRRGRLGEARAMQEAAIERFHALGDPRLEGVGRIYLALTLVLAGELEAAEREASASVELLQSAPPLRAFALAARAQAWLRLGRVGEALQAARDAVALLESVGAEEGESLVWLVYADALAQSGQRAEAEQAIATAREGLLGRAAKISDPRWRQRFLQNVPDNARTLGWRAG